MMATKKEQPKTDETHEEIASGTDQQIVTMKYTGPTNELKYGNTRLKKDASYSFPLRDAHSLAARYSRRINPTNPDWFEHDALPPIPAEKSKAPERDPKPKE